MLNEVADNAFDFALLRLVVRHEYHTNRVMARQRRLDAQSIHLPAEELVRHLNQHTRAVSRLRVGALSAAMLEVAQNFKPLSKDAVRFHTLDIGDKPHSAGFMLEPRVI